MISNKVFSQRFKELRAEHSVGYYQTAALLGIFPADIAEIEQGRRCPDGKLIADICKLFAVSAAWLVGLEEQEYPAKMLERQELQAVDFVKGILKGTFEAPPSIVDAALYLSREGYLSNVRFAMPVETRVNIIMMTNLMKDLLLQNIANQDENSMIAKIELCYRCLLKVGYTIPVNPDEEVQYSKVG